MRLDHIVMNVRTLSSAGSDLFVICNNNNDDNKGSKENVKTNAIVKNTWSLYGYLAWDQIIPPTCAPR